MLSNGYLRTFKIESSGKNRKKQIIWSNWQEEEEDRKSLLELSLRELKMKKHFSYFFKNKSIKYHHDINFDIFLSSLLRYITYTKGLSFGNDCPFMLWNLLHSTWFFTLLKWCQVFGSLAYKEIEIGGF